MIYIKAFFDSCYLTLFGFFGGKLENKNFLLLWPFVIRRQVIIDNCRFTCVRRLDAVIKIKTKLSIFNSEVSDA